MYRGAFEDLKSFRAELGQDVADLTDEEAMLIIDENLREKAKLAPHQRAQLDKVALDEKYDDNVYRAMADNMRNKAALEEKERKRIAAELANRNAEKNELLNAQRKLREDLDILKRNTNARFTWKSPSSLDDFIAKERIKQELRDELRREKLAKNQQHKEELLREKILKEELKLLRGKAPKRASSKARSKSRRAKPKAKSKSRKAK